jgi:hypothetical protein
MSDNQLTDCTFIDSLIDMYYFGAVAHGIAITLFVYFTYQNYNSNINQAYIALSMSGGTNCESVPISVTATFLADTSGNWQGTANYSDAQSIYSLTMSNFTIQSMSEYTDMMGSFYRRLSVVADETQHLNLAENLIWWTTYVDYYSIDHPNVNDFKAIGFGNLQYLQLTGNPSVVFNLPDHFARFSSRDGVCPMSSFTNYDEANHLLSTSFSNYNQFMNSSKCTSAVYPRNLEYNPKFDGNVYEVVMDTESFSVAMGINLNFLELDTLRTVGQKSSPFSYKNITYVLGEYFDVRYPSMDALFCVHNVTDLPLGLSKSLRAFCVLTMGNSFALPLLNHHGFDENITSYCSCDTGSGSQQACQSFNLLAGVAFFKNTKEIPTTIDFWKNGNTDKAKIEEGFANLGLFDIFELLNRFPNYATMNRQAYNASYYTISSNYVCDEQCVQQAFEFCRVHNSSSKSASANESCSLLMFNVQDLTTRTISDYKYQLINGSCSKSLAISASSWYDHLVLTA